MFTMFGIKYLKYCVYCLQYEIPSRKLARHCILSAYRNDRKDVICLQMLMSAWRRNTTVLKLLLARIPLAPIFVSAAMGSMAIRISAKVCLRICLAIVYCTIFTFCHFS